MKRYKVLNKEALSDSKVNYIRVQGEWNNDYPCFNNCSINQLLERKYIELYDKRV